MSAAANDPVSEAILARARADLEAGRAAQAEAACRQVLGRAPGHPHALHLLGILAHQRGDVEQGCRMLETASRALPGEPAVARNLALALASAGRTQEARAALEHARAIVPGDPGLLIALASLHHRSGDPATALGHYRSALERLPELPELHNQIGVCLLQLDDTGAAERALRACLARDPGHAEARENLARVLLRTRRFAPAEQLLRELLAGDPAREEASRLLGFARLHQGAIEDAARCFLDPVRRRFAPGGAGGPPPADPDTVTRTKLVHDIEQIEHLAAIGRLPRDAARVLVAPHREALDALPPDRDESFFHQAPAVAGFRAAFNRLHFEHAAPREPGGALHPALDHGALARAFARDGFAVADGFLAPAALASLQRFCRESMIWFEKKFRHEVGASLRHGFCCPLLLQVAEEVRAAWPALYGRHLFSGCFSYKYFPHDGFGNVHADRGAVSVNLWITPDEANLDPRRGGLVIWNKRVPAEYFREQPEEIDALNARLINEPDAQARIIPYRCNRAILFPSDVLHRTDRARFRDGYVHRRVSVTLLFGRPGD